MRHPILKTVGLAIGLITIVCSGTSCASTVPEGHVGVETSFGKATGVTYDPGLNLHMPWKGYHAVSCQRQSVLISSAAPTNDGMMLPLVEASYSYSVNCDQAVEMVTYIGADREAVSGLRLEGESGAVWTTARAAQRDATSAFGWDEVVYADRLAVEDKMHELWTKRLTDELALVDPSLRDAITVHSVQLREANPPPELSLANEKEKAALEELNRQGTLTEIAQEVANRREAEGTGVAKMVAQLPKGYSVSEIVSIINATNDRVRAENDRLRAEAVQMAVSSESVDMVILGSAPVAVPTSQGPRGE